MPESVHVQDATAIRPLGEVLKEVGQTIGRNRPVPDETLTIKDLRWQFDQVSAKMNQAVYNDQHDQIHDHCMKTIAVLVEILTRC